MTYEHTINLVDGKKLKVASDEPALGFFNQDDILWFAAGDTASVVIPKESIPQPWVAIAGCVMVREDYVRTISTRVCNMASTLLANGREKKTRKRKK